MIAGLLKRMKKIFKIWNKFLSEEKKRIVKSLDAVLRIIRNNPDQKTNLDGPRGSIKKFGGDREFHLPFDYGEYVRLINPSDNMGWDFAVVPSAQSRENLLPVGHIRYSKDQGEKVGNDKIIVAPNGEYSKQDVERIETFFASVGFFDPAVWY